MANLSVSYASIIAKHAHLVDADINEDHPHYEDYEIVMGTNFFAEAYADEESRNAKLGPAGDHVEFVPANGDTFADADDYPLERMAIGHSIHDAGFDLVAPHVVGAILDFFGDEKTGDLGFDVIIARTEYVVRRKGFTGEMTVGWLPALATGISEQDEQDLRDTAMWLRGFIGG